MYFGPPGGLVPYFESETGIFCPRSWSPADFALEVISNSSTLKGKNSLPDAVVLTQDDTLNDRPTQTQHVSADTLAEVYLKSQLGQNCKDELKTMNENSKIVKLKPRYHQKLSFKGWMDQMWILTKVSSIIL